MTTRKNIALIRWTFVSKVMSLPFNMLSKFVITFLPRSKSLNFMAAFTICSYFGAQENKICHCFHCFPVYLHEVMGPDAMVFIFWMLSLKPVFSLSSFTFIVVFNSLWLHELQHARLPCPLITPRSDQMSRSVMPDSLRPHESQHARPPCPSPTPGVHPDSRPSSQWCHPAISPSVVPFSSCPQSLPASESFPMSQLFEWGGQSTGVSALASFLAKKS